MLLRGVAKRFRVLLRGVGCCYGYGVLLRGVAKRCRVLLRGVGCC